MNQRFQRISRHVHACKIYNVQCNSKRCEIQNYTDKSNIPQCDNDKGNCMIDRHSLQSIKKNYLLKSGSYMLALNSTGLLLLEPRSLLASTKAS